MKYKVGQRVRVKSLEWYNENKDEDGNIFFPLSTMTKAKSEWCGKVMTILSAHVDFYRMEEMGLTAINYWTDEMIEGLVEEEMSLDKAGLETYFEYEGLAYSLPEGYIFKDENGNVINATKIVLEKKKKEYPKTFKECQDYLEEDVAPMVEPISKTHRRRLVHLLEVLLTCRDAYWKIAGDKMGLGKPWKPDWEDVKSRKYAIVRGEKGKIITGDTTSYATAFAFPTPEMRDAFYENFKELINECKELL